MYFKALYVSLIAAVAMCLLAGCTAGEDPEDPETTLEQRFEMKTDETYGLTSMRVITDTETNREYLFYKVGDAAGLAPLLPSVDEDIDVPITESEPDVPDTNVVDTDPVELELLACAVYQEAGGDACCDDCRFRVGDVILNRVADERFPNTMEEVLTQENQYGKYCKTGVIWPERAANPGEAHAVARAYKTAQALLEGQHSELYGEGYIWQARFPQGNDYFECCGTYFGR